MSLCYVLCVCIVCDKYYLFYVKQETAYEVRISDRSSVVCSSDLIFTTGRGSLSWFRLNEASGGRFALLVDGSNTVGARANLRTYQAFSTELVLARSEERREGNECASTCGTRRSRYNLQKNK